jgi:hypothetical protein
MTTTWKTAGIWFGVGVISTALYAFGLHLPGAILWGLSLGYIGYQRFFE